MLYHMLCTCGCSLCLGLVECMYDGLVGFCCYANCHDVNFSFALKKKKKIVYVSGILRSCLLKSEVVLIIRLRCFIIDCHVFC